MAAFLSPMSLFQLTTSRRGRRLFFYFVFTLVTFQLTTSRRGRPVTDTTAPYISTFQLTTSRRGRRFRALRNAFHFCISTHDLTKRSTCAPRTAASFSAFQLTTSRRGRQQNCIFYSSLLHLLLAHCTNNLYPIIIIYIILTF